MIPELPPMQPPELQGEATPKKEPKKETQSTEKWLKVIASYEREFKEWQGRVEKIIKRYRGDNKTTATNPAQFNILWSNVQTAVPATFSRLPKPEVSRRFRDNDPVGRVASMILQRALEFEIEHYPDYRAAMRNSVQDRFLGGRGMAWVRYEPHFKQAEQGTALDGLMVTDDADESEETPGAQEEIDYECSPVDYVHWKDFGHTVARTWEEVTAVWRRVYMDKAGLIERFGEVLGNKIPLDTRPDDDKSKDDDLYQACIYEIWDKSSNKAIWLSKSQSEILDAVDDPLQLESFFPCPRPLFATVTTDSLIPVPDYALYQDQAVELDVLAERIEGLIKALQVKGVYDAAVPELARLFQEAGNGDLIAVSNWQAFAEKNGLAGAISLVDLTPIANALAAAYDSTERVKQQIYEITGLADIIRGSSDPRETATAVQAKGQFGSMRLRAMQGDVVQYATELLQIKAQIISSQYTDETLVGISAAMQLSAQDQAMIPQALELIKQNPLRNFRIEVSSDSMIQMDEAQEKQDRMEFLKVAGAYMEGLIKISQEAPKLVPLGVDVFKFGIAGFKVGKQLEGAMDEMADKMRDEIAQKEANPQPPQPPEAVQVAQMKIEADGQRSQAEQQFEMQKLQMQAQAEQATKQGDLAIEQQRMQMNAQFEQLKMQASRDKEMAQMQADQAVAQAQMQADMEIERNKMQLAAELEQVKSQAKMDSDMQTAHFNEQMAQLKLAYESDVKLQIAKIDAEAKILTAQISAQSSPEVPGQAATGSDETQSALTLALQGFAEALGKLGQPRSVVRDATGKIVGVQ